LTHFFQLGIENRLGYFIELGVETIWLSPIFKSPMKDFGYDISDFKDIDPTFGTLEDFKSMITTAHDYGLKIVLDFVPNHSSDEHEWFKKSIAREDPYTNYYIWLDPKGLDEDNNPIPPNNWISVFRGSAWTYVEERGQFYLHQFLPGQPDLNFRDPEMVVEMLDVIAFWLDLGVDGFRMDAVITF
jgi:glycosidase